MVNTALNVDMVPSYFSYKIVKEVENKSKPRSFKRSEHIEKGDGSYRGFDY